MAVLGRAAYDLTFSEMMRPYAHLMAVGQAAQGAELAIKARIAQEHPLLLFNTLPKSVNAPDQLTIQELYEYGRTIQYHELPEVLWATTGLRLANVEHFQRFGRLRNASIHFALPVSEDFHTLTLEFLFEVMEPLVRQFWQESIVPHAAVWDEYVYEPDGLRMQLEQAGSTLCRNSRKPSRPSVAIEPCSLNWDFNFREAAGGCRVDGMRDHPEAALDQPPSSLAEDDDRKYSGPSDFADSGDSDPSSRTHRSRRTQRRRAVHRS